MESTRKPSRARDLALGLAAVAVLGLAACGGSHHNNGNTTNNTTNNTMNNTTNNMMNNTTENATAAAFGTTFATDFGANADSAPANVGANDITPVNPTGNPVPVNSMGAANSTGG